MSKRLHDHRVSQKTSNTRPDLLLRPQFYKAKARQHLLLPLLAKGARSQWIFSRRLLKLALEDVEALLGAGLVIFLVLLELVPLLVLLLVGWATSISFEIILNFNNSAKSFSSNLKCSSLSYNKLALVIHNWQHWLVNIPSNFFNFWARTVTTMPHFHQELRLSVSLRKSEQQLTE
jgi:hypothetical protein